MDQYKFLDRPIYFKGTECQFFEFRCRFCVVCLRVMLSHSGDTFEIVKGYKIGKLEDCE